MQDLNLNALLEDAMHIHLQACTFISQALHTFQGAFGPTQYLFALDFVPLHGHCYRCPRSRSVLLAALDAHLSLQAIR